MLTNNLWTLTDVNVVQHGCSLFFVYENTGSSGGAILQIWDWREGVMLASAKAHANPVTICRFNPYQSHDADEVLEDSRCYTLVTGTSVFLLMLFLVIFFFCFFCFSFCHIFFVQIFQKRCFIVLLFCCFIVLLFSKKNLMLTPCEIHFLFFLYLLFFFFGSLLFLSSLSFANFIKVVSGTSNYGC